MGIVGYGRIGQEVAARARAFGMEVSSFSEDLDPDRARDLGVDYCDSVLELASSCDAISVHVPLLDATRHLIDREVFSAMKPGTLFVHAARGGVVDDEAMREAVASGHIRAASDVFEEEPKGGSAAYEGIFQDVDGFYGTHHIGASTAQAQEAIGDEVLRIVEHWKATGEVLNCVNRSDLGPAEGQLLVRHRDQVGVLATVLDVLKEAHISVKGMRNAVFDETGSAVASVSLDRAPGEETLQTIRQRCEDVLSLVWTPR
jgi:D-3-phosphoglycerate dehydrogenase